MGLCSGWKWLWKSRHLPIIRIGVYDMEENKEIIAEAVESTTEATEEAEKTVAAVEETMDDYAAQLTQEAVEETMADYEDQLELTVWDTLQKMMEEKTIISGKISGIVNAGAIMEVEGIRGFIPASKLDTKYVKDTNDYLGKKVDAIIITVDAENKRLVLSVRDVLFQRQREVRNAKIASYEVGSVLSGTVEKIESYGAFVKLEEGVSGLVHVSQICEKKIASPKEVVKVGDTVKVKVIRNENGKISLRMRGLNAEPVDEEEEQMKKDIAGYSAGGSASTGLAGLLKNIKLD